MANIWSEPAGDKVRLTNTFSARSLPTATPTPIATTATATQSKFRVGPSVSLRPVTDVIGANQDGIVELHMNNPSLNDVTLNLDIRISMPTGIHVYGESFVQDAGAGVVHGMFSVPPGTERTISIVIKADTSARIGSYTLQFTGLYWPGDNKDGFQPVELRYAVNVKEASNNPESSELSTPTPIITAIQTPPPRTVVETTTKSSAPAEPMSLNSYIYAGIGGFLIILIAIIALKRRKSSQVMEPIKPQAKIEPQKVSPDTKEKILPSVTSTLKSRIKSR